MYGFYYSAYDVDDNAESYNRQKNSVDVYVIAKDQDEALVIVKALATREKYKLEYVKELTDKNPLN